MSIARLVAKGIVRTVVLSAIAAATASCSMDPKECQTIRESAFDLINKPNYCSDQNGCKVSEWPGCPKAINQTNFDKIHAMMLACKKGKCEEHPLKCDPPPPALCQEGLCTLKYKAIPVPVQNTGGEIKFE
jgi:hypothetical protein